MPWNGPELEMARTQESRGEDGMGLVVVGLHNAAIMWRGGGKLSHRGHSLGSEIRGLESRRKGQSSGLLESQKDLNGPFRRKTVTLGFELSVCSQAWELGILSM